jgi:hypothetical protein
MKHFERLLWVCLAIVGLAYYWAFFAYDATRVEFSPDSLENRWRSEPSSGAPWWLGSYQYRKSPVAEYLVENGYVKPIETDEPRWIAVGVFSPKWRDGQSSLAYVFSWNQDAIIAWCEEDPERARLLWSTVFPLLRSDDPGEVRAGEVIARMGVRCESKEEVQQIIDQSLAELNGMRSAER